LQGIDGAVAHVVLHALDRPCPLGMSAPAVAPNASSRAPPTALPAMLPVLVLVLEYVEFALPCTRVVL
jgi:hypothetical protein